MLDAIKYFKDYIKENNISTGKYKFILTGDGELYGKIKEKAEALGLHNDIIFTGYRNDIKNILKSSDIFVSHSISESFGISVLEAIASGLPVIATDSGGVHEIISDKFKNGLLIDYGDKKKFTEGLLKLIKSRELRNLYASHGYEILQELFNLDKTVEETYNLYMNCLLK